MKKFNKIYLISDIHGCYHGLEKASRLATVESPLYILGDLFDHKFGCEQQIIELILEMHEQHKCVLITGNHDIFFSNMFMPSDDLKRLYQQLIMPKNEKKMAVLKTIFDLDFYEQYIIWKNQLEVDHNLESFYQKVTSLCTSKNYQERYKQVLKLISISKLYDQIEINKKRILVSHCGNIEDPFSRDSVKPFYQLDSQYDFGIIGHFTIPMVEQMIIEEGDMISYSNFRANYKLKQVTIEGNYLYNMHSKLVLIDDGSYENIITVY